jgi:hypothetical protein
VSRLIEPRRITSVTIKAATLYFTNFSAPLILHQLLQLTSENGKTFHRCNRQQPIPSPNSLVVSIQLLWTMRKEVMMTNVPVETKSALAVKATLSEGEHQVSGENLPLIFGIP